MTRQDTSVLVLVSVFGSVVSVFGSVGMFLGKLHHLPRKRFTRNPTEVQRRRTKHNEEEVSCLFVCLFVCGLDVGTVTSLADHTKIYFPIGDIFQDVFWSKLANSIFNLVSSIAKYIDTPPRDHRKK